MYCNVSEGRPWPAATLELPPSQGHLLAATPALEDGGVRSAGRGDGRWSPGSPGAPGEDCSQADGCGKLAWQLRDPQSFTSLSGKKPEERSSLDPGPVDRQELPRHVGGKGTGQRPGCPPSPGGVDTTPTYSRQPQLPDRGAPGRTPCPLPREGGEKETVGRNRGQQEGTRTDPGQLCLPQERGPHPTTSWPGLARPPPCSLNPAWSLQPGPAWRLTGPRRIVGARPTTGSLRRCPGASLSPPRAPPLRKTAPKAWGTQQGPSAPNTARPGPCLALCPPGCLICSHSHRPLPGTGTRLSTQRPRSVW